MRVKHPANAVTLEEARKLYDSVDITDIHRASELYEHFYNEEKNEYGRNWALRSTIALIYAVGRVQGMRDERNRRRHRSLSLEEQ